jgi:hypothetical protein
VQFLPHLGQELPPSRFSLFRSPLRRGVHHVIRTTVPAAIPVSITALLSWRELDPCMDGLPVAGAVPMLFRPGIGEPYPGGDFRDALCRSTVGVSSDKLPRGVLPGRAVSFQELAMNRLRAVLPGLLLLCAVGGVNRSGLRSAANCGSPNDPYNR